MSLFGGPFDFRLCSLFDLFEINHLFLFFQTYTNEKRTKQLIISLIIHTFISRTLSSIISNLFRQVSYSSFSCQIEIFDSTDEDRLEWVAPVKSVKSVKVRLRLVQYRHSVSLARWYCLIEGIAVVGVRPTNTYIQLAQLSVGIWPNTHVIYLSLRIGFEIESGQRLKTLRTSNFFGIHLVSRIQNDFH